MTTHLARRSLGLLIAFVFILWAVPPVMASPVAGPNVPLANNLRISQVYGGGGNASAPYLNDFVELFNAGSTTISLATYSLQYTSAAGTSWGSQKTNLTGTIGPGKYYLIQLASAGAVGSALPTPDATGATNMSATAGKVALVNSQTSLPAATCPDPVTNGILDLVGYGTTANCFEGTGPAPAPSNTTADRRAGSGCTDTDQNATDFATGAPNPRNSSTAAQSCGDVPPTVTSTVPNTSATGVSPNTTITLNFSELVDVATGAFTVECPVGTPATFSSSPVLPASDTTSVVLTPSSVLPPSTTCTVTAIATQITDNGSPPNQLDGDSNGTPGGNYVFAFTTAAVDPCSLPFTGAYTIQGSGASTPIPGAVTTQGVVVGDFELPTGSGQIRGFYLQDPTGDGDPATSDGIFVYNGGVDTVSIGQVVRVSGTAGENQNQTQISSPTVIQCGTTGNVTPVNITLPFAVADYPERYEGMLVRLPQTLYVTEHFQLGRFGQIVMTSRPDRLQQPTNVVLPGAPALALQASNNLDRIIVDDNNNLQNPDPIQFGRGGSPLSASNTLRGGDSAAGIVGVLVYDWAGASASGNAYRVRPIGALNGGVINFLATNPRPPTASVAGRLRVTAANLLNYFNTFGTGACTLGVGGGATDCRGADNATEFARQWPKTVANLVGSGADVLGIMEIENDGYGPSSGIQDLVDRLNGATTPGTYAFVDADAGTSQLNALGTDAIKVGLIYKPATVTPVGTTAALNTTAFVNGGDSAARNRPALAQAFQEVATGERFIVVANHLKSKGSACDAPDANDGQGNCSAVRTNAANLMTAWLAGDPTGVADRDIVIVGDLNAYAMEDPITAIKNAGYIDLKLDRLGITAYSYAFDGQWGYLDHSLATAFLDSQVAGVTEWHINADEPSILDYNTDFKSAGQIGSLYNSDQFRSSDHDPVIIGLDLEATNQSNLPISYGAAWHTGNGSWRLGTLWQSGATTADNDGVVRNYGQSWNDGQGEVTATVSGPSGQWACLNAWLDYSDGSVVPNTLETPDGQFNPNEHVVNNLPIQPGVNQLVTWSLEPGVIDGAAQYKMRFRLVPDPNNDGNCGDVTLAAAAAPLTPDGGATSTGRANGGEVEDYTFTSGPLAVTLAGLSAAQQGDGVLLTWETTTELNNSGFNLYRGTSTGGPDRQLNETLIPSQSPGSSGGYIYTWDDRAGLIPGTTYFYWVEDMSFSGVTTLHGPVNVIYQAPTAVKLNGIDASPAAPLATPGVLPVALAGLVAMASAVGLRRRR